MLIIGGGITGAGIALDAASRGLKTALIEMQDFSAGTSSRSTKLIHGGLRYLEQFRFKLVREVGKERKILYRNAPYLVFPEKMLIPIFKKGKYKKWKVAFGIWLYDNLAKVSKSEKREMLDKRSILQLEPLFAHSSDLVSGCLYTEYQTDDARLVIEVLKTADKYGAECINYVGAEKLLYEGTKVQGVEAIDRVTGRRFFIKAKQVINASGPWVDEIRLIDDLNHKPQLHHTKGVHVVIDPKRLPLDNPVYFEAIDGRMIFAIPRRNKIYVGTTDTDYKADLQSPEVNANDINYLLNSLNNVFKTIKLNKNDIESSWAGIRPLIHQPGKKPSEISRKEEIFESDSGLISIAGGKLTGYRQMAEKVVDKVIEKLGSENCKTENISLHGNLWKNRKEVEDYIDGLLKVWKFSREEIKSLVYRYGKDAELILKEAISLTENNFKLLKAEVRYCIKSEWVLKSDDFLTRRTGKTYFEEISEEERIVVEKELMNRDANN